MAFPADSASVLSRSSLGSSAAPLFFSAFGISGFGEPWFPPGALTQRPSHPLIGPLPAPAGGVPWVAGACGVLGAAFGPASCPSADPAAGVCADLTLSSSVPFNISCSAC
eukprot:9506101-Heterocapsa_arctica.AAC.1